MFLKQHVGTNLNWEDGSGKTPWYPWIFFPCWDLVKRALFTASMPSELSVWGPCHAFLGYRTYTCGYICPEIFFGGGDETGYKYPSCIRCFSVPWGDARAISHVLSWYCTCIRHTVTLTLNFLGRTLTFGLFLWRNSDTRKVYISVFIDV